MSQYRDLSQRTIDRMELLELEPFEYNRESEQFRVGTAVIELRQLRSQDRFPGLESIASGQSLENLLASAAVAYPAKLYPGGDAIALPKLGQFLQDNWSEELVDEVTSVMHDVFEELHDRRPLLSRADEGGNYYLRRLRQGRFVMSTLGNCACMGADATARWFGEKCWDEGVGELTGHNIDVPAQRWSLRAGVGHLAYLARSK